MRGSYKSHQEYKKSGVNWFDSVPAHWDLIRPKWLFLKAERPVRPDDEIVTCFRDGEVTLRKNRRTAGFTNALQEHGYQHICKGDLVIHAMDAFAGAIGVSDSEGKSTPVYSACIPRERDTVHSYYYAYLLRSLALNGVIQSLAKGIRERSTDFRYNDFSELTLVLPPLKEQTSIAKFLDEKTAKINQAIQIKQKQIELLKERKQILIQNAVTRGLDPNVKMKDSGVEWIGEIPAGWEISKLRNCLKSVTEKNKPKYQLLSITREKGVIVRDVEDQDSNHNFIPDDLSNYKVLREFQFGMNKMKAWQGSFGVAWDTGIVSPAYYVFDICDKLSPDFFHVAIRSKIYISFFACASDGVRIGQWDLAKPRMKGIPFAVPPIVEQRAIVKYINELIPKIEKLLENNQAQIKKLQEYKTILINDAVTGRIKLDG